MGSIPQTWHMADSGVLIKQWPAVIGCDVAGEVCETGPVVDLFEVGDRVIGYVHHCGGHPYFTDSWSDSHAITLWSGRPQDGAFQLYTFLPMDKAAPLPPYIPYNDGVVLPMALKTAICALFFDRRNSPPDFLPGIFTPALALPCLSLQEAVKPSAGKIIIG